MSFTYRTSKLGGPPSDTRMILAMRPDAAKAGDFDLRSTPGTQSITGIGFQPDCVVIISSLRQVYGGGSGPPRMQFGVATSVADQWSWSAAGGNLVPRWRYDALVPDFLIANVWDSPSVFRVEASLASFDADGFTLQVDTQNLGTTMKCIYVAMKGTFSCGVSTSPGAVTTQAVSGLGYKPKGLMLCSAGNVDDLIHEGWCWSVGYGDDRLATSGYWAGARPLSLFGWFPRSTSRWQNDCILTIEQAATGASYAGASTLARAKLDSCDADGFTLNWVVSDGQPYKFGWLSTFEQAEMLELVVPAGDPGVVTADSRFCPKAMIGNGMNYILANNPNVYAFGGQACISLAAGSPWTATFDEEGGAHMAEVAVTTVGWIQEGNESLDSVNFCGMGSGSFQTHKLNILDCAPPLVGMNWRQADRRGHRLRALRNPSDQV